MSIYRGDYTGRDADSIQSELQAYIARAFPSVLTDFSDGSTSLEAVFLDVIANAADKLHLYIDAAFSESFPDSAVEPQNLYSMAKLVGYPMGRRSAASADLTYTYTKLDPGAPDSVLLPVGFSVSTKSGFSWTVVDPLQTVGVAGGTFEAMQGTFVTDVFTPSTQPNQVFRVSRKNVASNVDPIVTVNSVLWTASDNIARAGAGQYYEIRWLDHGEFEVMTGDGANGNIPAVSVSVTCFVTDGLAANCDAGVLLGKANPHVQVQIDYTNATAVYDGSDGETTRSSRKNIMAYGASQGTEVTISDYKALIESQPGVKCANFEFDEATRRMVAYVLSSSYGPLTDGALARLSRLIRGKEQLFTRMEFKNVSLAKAIVAARVVFNRSSRLDVNYRRQLVVDAMESFFEPGPTDEVTNDVGKTVRLSDFYRAVDSVEGVNHLDLNVFTRVPELTPVNWTASGDCITLDGWHLRPSSLVMGSAGVGAGLQTGLSQSVSAAGVRVQRSSKRVTPLGSTRTVSVRQMSDDWNMRASSAMPETVRVKVSYGARKYVWPGWVNSDGNVYSPLTTTLLTRTSTRTAHFMVSHFVDGVEYADSAIGYLDDTYETDGGFMLFRLTAPTTAVTARISVDCASGYFGFSTLPGGLVKRGTLSGYIEVLGVTYAIVDNGDGAVLNEADGSRLACIDYDTGWLVFGDGVSTPITCGGSTTVYFDQYSIDNRIGETAEMYLSPMVGDIKVRPNEFVGLHSLNVEIVTD